MESPAKQDAGRPPLSAGKRSGWRLVLVAALAPAPAFAATASAGRQDGWREGPPFVHANAAIEAWLAPHRTLPGLVKDWRTAVAAAPRAERLADPLCEVATLADERLASLLASPADAPPAWLSTLGDAEPSFRLATADTLAAAERYDACLAWTDGIDPETVFSPALLHYLRAVSCRMTVDDKRATAEAALLATVLEGPDDDALGAARRWVAAALQNELEAESEPLPEVARRMRDVERRLALTEPGAATQDQQQTILDELDKLIEKLEEQRKQQQQMMAAGGPGGGEPSEAAEESRPSELKGPGEVDRKRLAAGDAWGALPPAERERLTQAITRDFPAHYRALVEDYFRTLAAGADTTEPADPPANP